MKLADNNRAAGIFGLDGQPPIDGALNTSRRSVGNRDMHHHQEPFSLARSGLLGIIRTGLRDAEKRRGQQRNQQRTAF